MKIKRSLQTFPLFLSLGLIIGFASAHALEIPDTFDSEKIIASFDFSLSQSTFRGQKRSYKLALTATGHLSLNAVYFGETRFGCSNQGGVISSLLSKEERIERILSALRVINETEKDQEKLNNKKTRPDNPPAQLNVEFNNNYYNTLVDTSTPKKFTQIFLNSVQTSSTEIMNHKNANLQALSIFEKRDFKSRIIEVKLLNSGNQNLNIKLPKNAEQHFLLRLGEGGVTPLSYKNVPSHFKQVLKPGASLKIALTIPPDVGPSSGLLIYDNSPDIAGDYSPEAFPNTVAVSLCPILPNNSRAEFK